MLELNAIRIKERERERESIFCRSGPPGESTIIGSHYYIIIDILTLPYWHEVNVGTFPLDDRCRLSIDAPND